VLAPIPIHSAITPSTQTVVTIVMAAFAVATLIFSLVRWRRTGEPTFLLLFLAGGCMLAMEPFVDTVGACWFPRIHSWVVFTAFGRPEPLWLCLAYFFYFGIGIGVFWEIIRRGVTQRRLWGLFAAGIVGDFLFEFILLRFHTYIYYGGQPLRVLRFPLWWAPVNALIVLVTAVAVARLERYLSGRRQLLIIPLAVSVSAAANAAAGWPSWLAINSRMSWAPRQLCGLATFALAAWFVSAMARIGASGPAPAPAPPPARVSAGARFEEGAPAGVAVRARASAATPR
jgi:hypothetical protein